MAVHCLFSPAIHVHAVVSAYASRSKISKNVRRAKLRIFDPRSQLQSMHGRGNTVLIPCLTWIGCVRVVVLGLAHILRFGPVAKATAAQTSLPWRKSSEWKQCALTTRSTRTPTGGASRLGGRRLPWFVRPHAWRTSELCLVRLGRCWRAARLRRLRLRFLPLCVIARAPAVRLHLVLAMAGCYLRARDRRRWRVSFASSFTFAGARLSRCAFRSLRCPHVRTFGARAHRSRMRLW